jgi:hypothetical protein
MGLGVAVTLTSQRGINKQFFSLLMPIKPGPERSLNVQDCPFKSYVPLVRFRTIKIWLRSLWENFHYHSLIWEQWWLIVGSSGGSFGSSGGSLVVTPDLNLQSRV